MDTHLHRDRGEDELAADEPTVADEEADDGDASWELDDDPDEPGLVREESPPPCMLPGKFEVRDLIGEGGMGRVHRGYSLTLGLDVAIKLIDPALKLREDSRERLRREAVALAAINHPNMVRVYACDETAEKQLFIVMELLDGESLRKIRDRRLRLSAAEVVEIGLQVCAGVGAAHGLGIVHRDLTPSNIMLLRDPQIRVKTIDLGVCRLLDTFYSRHPQRFEAPPGSRLQTPLGVQYGNPEYLAPELLLRDPPTRPSFQTDVYALGVILYELLAGRHPFKPGDRSEPRPIRSLMPGFADDELERVLRNALRPDPKDRIQSMAEFAEELAIARGFLTKPGESSVLADAILPALDVPLRGAPSVAPGSPVSDKDRKASEQPTKAVLVAAAIGVPVPMDGLAPPAMTAGTTAAATTTGVLSKALISTAMMMCVAVGVVGATVTDVLRAGPEEAGAKEQADAEADARFERLERKVEVLEQQIAAAAASPPHSGGLSLSATPSPEPAPGATPVSTAAPGPAQNSVGRVSSPRQRAIVRDLGTVASDVGVCFRRHGGNLEHQLPVRVVISAMGLAERVTLPKGSTGALIDCVTRVLRSRQYPTGPEAESVRHVFKFT
ncbi:serine/threonine-protein kinase [Nannocystis punicea]|uniref:non-specific serine/threonine protein kinase n=1 Tax=Nannocystis punicea TaxID=2995304 RepID=A0ABY7H5F4_9BACT|nr:serine/threonine-protein kinase [Nannocystis poenicansa]WAS94516.1 serine/threonine-protein kinase [Nannocystis poenicansa]